MGELVFPAINFTVLVVLLVYFLKKPVRDMVLARHNAIKVQVEEARVQTQEAERRYKEFDRKLQSFEAEAKEILDRAKHDAEAVHAKIIAAANNTAQRLIKDAAATAEANTQEYKDYIRKEAVAKAIEIAEKIIKDRLSSDDQRRIVNECMGKVQ